MHRFRRCLVVCLFLAATTLLGGCGKNYENESLENMDYAVSVVIEASGQDAMQGYVQNIKDGSGHVYRFTFQVADLTDYSGAAGKALKTEEYSCEGESISDVLELYHAENGRQLDLGHLEEIAFTENPTLTQYKDIILEMSDMPCLSKSVEVTYGTANSEKIILRELIKTVYQGEDL